MNTVITKINRGAYTDDTIVKNSFGGFVLSSHQINVSRDTVAYIEKLDEQSGTAEDVAKGMYWLGLAGAMIMANNKFYYASITWKTNEKSYFYISPENYRDLMVMLPSKEEYQNSFSQGNRIDERSSEQVIRPQQTYSPIIVNQDNIQSILQRIDIFIEDEEWDKADYYCEQALNYDATNADIYLKKLLIEYKLHNVDELSKCTVSFEESSNYKRIIKYGNEEIKSFINKTASAKNDSITQSADAVGESLKSMIFSNDKININELIQYNSKLINARDSFGQIQTKIQKYNDDCKVLRLERATLMNRKNSLGLFSGKARKDLEYKISELTRKDKEIQNLIAQENAKLLGFTSVEEIESRINENQLKINAAQENQDSNTNQNISLTEALELLKNPLVRKEVVQKYPELISFIDLFDCQIGSSVFFGNYHQDTTKQNKTPIEWIVLAKEENRILVISKKVLDYIPFETMLINRTWEYSNVRKELNSTFFNNAFNDYEKALIQNTLVKADKNPMFGTGGNKDTYDKIFLLSVQEAQKYFSSDEARQCYPTNYVAANSTIEKVDRTIGWTLRSSGKNETYCSRVLAGGAIDAAGYTITTENRVRPAMWINIVI